MRKASPQKAFDREFRGHIERLTPQLVSALSALTSLTPPTSVRILTFEVQSDWNSFPVRAFAMTDESQDEVYFKPPFSGPVLKTRGPLIPHGAIDQDAYEEAGIATFESGARILCEWFAECWSAADGERFPIPAFINHHDRNSYFDLRRKRWVKQSQIWK